MTPATVEDAYTMLREAVEIDDPVIFCEHKYLYNRLKADALPESGLPYDKARVARFGRDLTIVAYSAMVHEALAAAEQLRKEDIEVEVVDLRCVKPLRPRRPCWARWQEQRGCCASANPGLGAASMRK